MQLKTRVALFRILVHTTRIPFYLGSVEIQSAFIVEKNFDRGVFEAAHMSPRPSPTRKNQVQSMQFRESTDSRNCKVFIRFLRVGLAVGSYGQPQKDPQQKSLYFLSTIN